MADRIGRKRTIQLGAVIFIVGEVISIASPNLGTLIAGRCIMGGKWPACVTCASVQARRRC